MGHLLGAVTQEKLTNQIGVVQNEKRQGDNQPYGLVEYAQLEALFPEGHPYRHSTIGSMADLDAASLDDVQRLVPRQIRPEQRRARPRRRHRRRPRRGRWSRAISATSRAARSTRPPRPPCRRCRARVDRGDARPGRQHPPLPQLGGARPHRRTIGRRSTSAPPCSAASPARGSTTSWCAASRARSRVAAGVQPFHRISLFEVQVDVKPGRMPTPCRAGSTQIIAEFVAQRPDRGRGPPRRDAATSPAASAASSRSAASAARRSRSPRARSMPTIPISTASSCSPTAGSRRRRSARRCRAG